jgi:hypothetical protein
MEKKIGRPLIGESPRSTRIIGIDVVEHTAMKEDMLRLGIKSFPDLIKYYIKLSKEN